MILRTIWFVGQMTKFIVAKRQVQESLRMCGQPPLAVRRAQLDSAGAPFLAAFCAREVGALPPQQIAKCLFHDLSANLCNGLGQRNVLRANLKAVLRIPAFLNPAIAHKRREPFALERLARRMSIK